MEEQAHRLSRQFPAAAVAALTASPWLWLWVLIGADSEKV